MWGWTVPHCLNAVSSKRRRVPSVCLTGLDPCACDHRWYMTLSDLKGPSRFQFPAKPAQRRLLLGIKIHFWSSNICNLSLFLVLPSPSPRPKPCSRDLHLRSLGIRHRFWEGGWRREFTRSIKKRKKDPSHSSVRLPFALPLLRSLPALRAHFSPPLSLFIVQHPLCAWTLFIHELVNTSVNEGKRRFYRTPLCVEEAVWTARAPFLERMSLPLSALRVLWPFPSFFSPICRCSFSLFDSLFLPAYLPLTLSNGDESAERNGCGGVQAFAAAGRVGVSALPRRLGELWLHACVCFRNRPIQECCGIS